MSFEQTIFQVFYFFYSLAWGDKVAYYMLICLDKKDFIDFYITYTDVQSQIK